MVISKTSTYFEILLFAKRICRSGPSVLMLSTMSPLGEMNRTERLKDNSAMFKSTYGSAVNWNCVNYLGLDRARNFLFRS